MLRILPVVLVVAMVVYALIDCARTPDDEMPAGIPKVLWVVLIVVFPAVGALAWIILSRVARANAAAATTGGSRPAPWSSSGPPVARRTGPMAPDDDPEFLARIERERRRAERERREREKRDQGRPDGPESDDAPAA